MGAASTAETALLRELSDTWRRLNHSLFDHALRPPTVTLADGQGPLGQWSPPTRTLTISRTLVQTQPWGVVVEVLKHEMAHQYVHEALHIQDQTAHGPAFRDVCERLGIDAAARGLPAPPSSPRDRAMGKVQRLLALADSDNLHEAQAALNAAHRLMRKYNLQTGTPTEHAHHSFQQVGAIRRRFSAHEKILAGILGEHFFVRCIWVPAFDAKTLRSGRVLEICGTPSNLDIAAYTHATLVSTAERLWVHHRRAHAIPTNRDRRRFLSGVMMGFLEKLRTEAQACQETGLVWVEDPKLQSYVARRHPHLVRSRGPRMRTTTSWAEGRAAGQRIRLAKPLSASKKGPKLLSSR